MAETLRYKDKVTIVTGGSSGIGQGIVNVFVQQGAKVIIASNAEEEGRKLETELNKTGPGEAYFLFCDVTKEEDVKNLVNKTIERYGRIDCLINNAGWHPPYQKIDDVSADEFKQLIDLNLVGYFLTAKYCLPYLRKTKGNIIQTSSISGILGQPGASPYCATKGAVTSFTKSLAIEEAGNGVRVNAVSPTTISTPMVKRIFENTENPEKNYQDAANTQLLGRLGTIDEVGKAYLFLAADATFCTGIDLFLSGGSELGMGLKNPLAKDPGSFF